MVYLPGIQAPAFQAVFFQVVDISGKKITPPMFSHIYTAKSIPEKNEQGSWSGWQIGSPELISDTDLYGAAKKFSQDVLKGIIKVAPPSQDGGGQATDTPVSEREKGVL